MKARTLALVVPLALALAPAAGCRSDPGAAARERELRLQEDRIYELQDQVKRYQQELAACQARRPRRSARSSSSRPSRSRAPRHRPSPGPAPSPRRRAPDRALGSARCQSPAAHGRQARAPPAGLARRRCCCRPSPRRRATSRRGFAPSPTTRPPADGTAVRSARRPRKRRAGPQHVAHRRRQPAGGRDHAQRAVHRRIRRRRPAGRRRDRRLDRAPRRPGPPGGRRRAGLGGAARPGRAGRGGTRRPLGLLRRRDRRDGPVQPGRRGNPPGHDLARPTARPQPAPPVRSLHDRRRAAVGSEPPDRREPARTPGAADGPRLLCPRRGRPCRARAAAGALPATDPAPAGRWSRGAAGSQSQPRSNHAWPRVRPGRRSSRPPSPRNRPSRSVSARRGRPTGRQRGAGRVRSRRAALSRSVSFPWLSRRRGGA